jgi:hypothetical protein
MGKRLPTPRNPKTPAKDLPMTSPAVQKTVSVEIGLIQQTITELRHQCAGRCNAEENPCWSLELAKRLMATLEDSKASEPQNRSEQQET